MPGLHHVTAIARDPKRNIEFYTKILGLRLIKKTVNFDDPSAYHFYYGDEAGRPGTILTFFPWPHAAAGKAGTGETGETAFRVPQGAITAWTKRFKSLGVVFDAPEKRFGEPVLPFRDPDAMRLALVESKTAGAEPSWSGGGVPDSMAIRGFSGVTLTLREEKPTAAILERTFGFRRTGEEGHLIRYETDAPFGARIDLKLMPEALRGRQGAGSVHHVAFRASDDGEQQQMADGLESAGLKTTPQKDRFYFRSVYFREPGGVLFEIATDEPGFTADESLEHLGEDLKLPAVLEAHRHDIETALPDLS